MIFGGFACLDACMAWTFGSKSECNGRADANVVLRDGKTAKRDAGIGLFRLWPPIRVVKP